MINLYKTYNKAKDVFRKPKLSWKFGLWKDDPCLPVWRRGPIINLYRRFSLNVYNPRTGVRIKLGSAGTTRPDGTIRQYDEYTTTHHKLPGNLKQYGPVWKRDFRKKLRKWGLGWLPTHIQLPLFFAFDIYNYDVCWKNKWDEYRYEFPPQFTLVFFGLSLSFWLNSPDGDRAEDDEYWESILYYTDEYNLEYTDREMGSLIHNCRQPNEYSERRFKSKFLNEPYRSELEEIQKNK